jgi:Tat protein translocase TatB subunit
MPLNLGVGEILVVLLVALIVLGPEKLPGAARSIGKAMTEIRRMSSGFQAELRDALQEPVDGTPSRAAHLPHERRDAPAPGPAPAGPPPEGDGPPSTGG